MALTAAERLNTIRAQRVSGAKTFTDPTKLLICGQRTKTHFIVKDRDLLTPAALTPVEGDFYLMPDAGVIAGAWAAAGLLNGEIAAYSNAAWVRITPAEGDTVDILDETVFLRRAASSWKHYFEQSPNVVAASTLAISGGSITPVFATHVIAAETGTTDDLTSIIGTNFRIGAILTLVVDVGDTITVKHNSGGGNIRTTDGADVLLDSIIKTCQLRWDGTNWNVLASGSTASKTVADKAAIEALTLAASAAYEVIIVADVDYGGTFRRTLTNIATQVAADPLHGAYVPFSGGDGTTGGFIRVIDDALYAEWWGAKGDNSTDCGPAINAMITLGKAISRRAYAVRAGVFRYSETIVLDSGFQSFKGQGRGSTTLRRTFLTGNSFEIRNADGSSIIASTSISDFSFDSTVVPTSGAMFDCERAHGLWIQNVRGGGVFSGINLLGCYEVHLTEVEIIFGEASCTTEYGMKVTNCTAPFGSAYGGNTFLSKVVLRTTLGAAGTPGAEYGLIVNAIDGLWMTDCYFGQFKEAAARLQNNVSGVFLTGLLFNNCWFDHYPKDGVVIEGSTSSNFSNIKFIGCTWVGGTNAQYNIRAATGCNAKWVTVGGCVIGNVKGDNIRIDTVGSDWIFTDNNINNADNDNVSSGSAVYIVNCTRLTVSDNTIFGATNTENGIELQGGSYAVVTGNMIYGVKNGIIIGASFDYSTVVGNNVEDNTINAISWAGGGTHVVSNNLGYNNSPTTYPKMFEFTGDGSTVDFDVAKDIPLESNAMVFYDGLPVDLADYSIANDTPSAGSTRFTFGGFTPANGIKIKIFG